MTASPAERRTRFRDAPGWGAGIPNPKGSVETEGDALADVRTPGMPSMTSYGRAWPDGHSAGAEAADITGRIAHARDLPRVFGPLQTPSAPAQTRHVAGFSFRRNHTASSKPFFYDGPDDGIKENAPEEASFWSAWRKGEGSEPSIRLNQIPDFESGAFDHSATFPLEAPDYIQSGGKARDLCRLCGAGGKFVVARTASPRTSGSGRRPCRCRCPGFPWVARGSRPGGSAP